MAGDRWSGFLGIVQQVEAAPSRWVEVVTEHAALGDLLQRTENLAAEDSVLPRYRTTTSISIFNRAVGPQDNSMIRYITYAGTRWTIASMVTNGPRLVLYIGEEYHGPLPAGA